MVNTMMHETFYSCGTYENESDGIYAGWTCHPGSFSDCMPVWNEKKNIVLIFTGENFADQDVFNKLKAKNHRFENTNAGYLVHLYEEHGVDFLKTLNGSFSGMLIDLKEKKMILFNDRFGVQRIYYHESKDAFYFASEAKALLAVCPELRDLDMKGVGEWLACGCVLENRTLFNRIYLLPAGSAWTFSGSHIPDKKSYFDVREWENQPWLEKEFFYEKLKETFIRILPRYFRSTQPIGISLTGGLDTRMLMANIILAEGKYPCYTFSGIYRDCYDVKIARQVAGISSQTHQSIPVDAQFLDNFGTYAERTVYITDGYLDVAGAPEIYVNAIARKIAPIRMTGNFGSEVLRNIRWLKAAKPLQNSFTPELANLMDKAALTLKEIDQSSANSLTFTLFKDTPWLSNNRMISEQSQLTLRTPYLDNDLVALMYRAPFGARDNKELSLRLITDGNPTLAAIPTDRGVGGKHIFMLSALRHIYSEFLFKAEYAYNYGMPQWLAQLDYLFKRMHLERLFLGRHKFYHFRVWYRDELSGYVKAVLLDNKTLSRPYLNRKTVEHIVESHTKGYGNYTTEITQLLTLELIQRQVIARTIT